VLKDEQDLALITELLALSLEEFRRGPGGGEGTPPSAWEPAIRGVESAWHLLAAEVDPDRWIAAMNTKVELMRRHAAAVAIAFAATPPPEGGGVADTGGDPRTLHRLAATLVQADLADLVAIGAIGDEFTRLAGDVLLPEESRRLCGLAGQKIRAIAGGTSTDPGGDFGEAGRLLEKAADLLPAFVDPGPFEDQAASPAADPAADAAKTSLTRTESPVGTAQGSRTKGSASQAPAVPSAVPTPRPAASPGPDTSTISATLMESLPADTDPTLLSDFVTECRDLIEGGEAALLALEADQEDQESVNTVFRAFHTMKGTAGFLGIKLITDLAHRAENLLSRVREKEIRCTGGYADLALQSIDALKALVESVHDALGGAPLTPPEGYADLLQVLDNPEAAGVSGDPTQGPGLQARLGDLLVAAGADRDEVERAAAMAGAGPIGLAIARSGAASASDVGKALRTQRKMAGTDGSDSSVRVRTDRLDRLIDMVGELVIAQSMVAQDVIVRAGQQQDLHRKVTHAGKIVRELQGLSMSMRMVPLKATFQKMTRLVRDLAQKSGKQVDFITNGEETEIDRNMVDVIGDPLVHMIRNALDHGVERPEARQAAGKSPTGSVRLSALHAGGNVVVKMEDDGKGLDREKILRKAVDKGLVDPDKNLTDAEVFNLIFEPGFSTADQITEVSGRGVGMDVVKRAITSLRGRIDIGSAPGRGTTFTVRLPLTLAITDGMLVRVGEQRYIVPTVSIQMSFRPERGGLSTVTGRGEMVMLRGKLIPIIRLHQIFHLDGAVQDPYGALLVVIDDGSRLSAVMVDELLGQQQVVAKSLGKGVGKVAGVSGGAILGDGRVGLIIDPGGLAAMAREGRSFEGTNALAARLAA
jgi:two-component system, chemotaxis family, sensor kinase CheA